MTTPTDRVRGYLIDRDLYNAALTAEAAYKRSHPSYLITDIIATSPTNPEHNLTATDLRHILHCIDEITNLIPQLRDDLLHEIWVAANTKFHPITDALATLHQDKQ